MKNLITVALLLVAGILSFASSRGLNLTRRGFEVSKMDCNGFKVYAKGTQKIIIKFQEKRYLTPAYCVISAQGFVVDENCDGRPDFVRKRNGKTTKKVGLENRMIYKLTYKQAGMKAKIENYRLFRKAGAFGCFEFH